MSRYLRIKYFLFVLFTTMAGISIGQDKVEGIHYQTGNPVSVEIKEGKITRVQALEKLSDDSRLVYIAPGLIDNQVNGFAGISFTFGEVELTDEGVVKATKELWKNGITSYLPTLTSSDHELLLKNFAILKKAKSDAALLGSLPGFHLEGPYISPEDGFRGAHLLQYVRKPDWKEFMALYEASGRNILTVTVAPEIDGAMEFIAKCTAMGITMALGHFNASKAIVDQAVLNGSRICTHLGNGCANMINRHENPLWPQLANDQLMISIIGDGFHLRDEEIATFYKVKGPEKTIITSDVTYFAGLPPGEYKKSNGETIELTKEGKLYYPAQNVLHGSATPIGRGVVNVMNVIGCTLGDVIRMASTNPAKLYGLTDRGEIAPGKRADLILFTIGKKDLLIEKTYVAGKLVYQAN